MKAMVTRGVGDSGLFMSDTLPAYYTVLVVEA